MNTDNPTLNTDTKNELEGRICIERIWAMPNQLTFTIHPIRKILKEITADYSNWVDPFAGRNSPAGITNDIRSDMPTQNHKCALEFLKDLPAETFDGVLYDPPYSLYQAKVCYEAAGLRNLAGSMKWWGDVKNEIARVIKPNGKAVCFGWSSNGIGKRRNFKMERILLVPHGGSKNDTIVTIETKAEGK